MAVEDTTDQASTNDDTVDTDVDFEDIDISFEDGEETEQTEVTKEESPASDDTDGETEESDDDDGEESSDEVATPEQDDTQDEEQEENTTSKDEQRQRNDDAAKQRIAERQAKQDNLRQSQNEYLDKAEDDHDLAFRQLQIDAYNNKVEINTGKLQSGIDRAVGNIDLFTKGSKEVKEELVRAVDDFERMYVKYDTQGNPTEVTGDVYQYLTERAESIRRLTGVGARQSQKDKSNTKQRTIKTPSKTPVKPKTDPDLDAFDEAVKQGW